MCYFLCIVSILWLLCSVFSPFLYNYSIFVLSLFHWMGQSLENVIFVYTTQNNRTWTFSNLMWISYFSFVNVTYENDHQIAPFIFKIKPNKSSKYRVVTWWVVTCFLKILYIFYCSKNLIFEEMIISRGKESKTDVSTILYIYPTPFKM